MAMEVLSPIDLKKKKSDPKELKANDVAQSYRWGVSFINACRRSDVFCFLIFILMANVGILAGKLVSRFWALV
jgi:hypothetical protein